MAFIIEAILLLGLIAIALVIIFGKDLMVAVVVYCAFSFITMFLYIIMGAPDVAFTEAVIGVISTVFFIIILRSVRRDAKRRGEK
jgi:multicomponent Na+:H+ antiporter subunit B